MMIGALMAMSEVNSSSSRTPNKDVLRRKPEPVIPKGCKQYFFTLTGSIYSEANSNTVFNTIASSEKSAIKKFDKWYNQNTQPNE
jgi:hypothetical protein